MEEKRFKNKKFRRTVIGASAVGIVALGAFEPVAAIGVSLGAIWAIPGVVMSKELDKYEKDHNKSLTLKYTNNKENE